MITKEQAQLIDTAFEECIAKIQPIIISLDAGLHHGAPADCYALKGWGFLQQGAHAINKSKELAG